MRHLWTLLRALVVPALLVLAWQVASSRELVDPVFLPPPGKVVDSLKRLFDSGVLVEATRITVSRAFMGWLIAGAAGVVIAVLITRNRAFATAVLAPLDFFRSVPAAAVVPPATLLIGYGRSMELAVILFAAIWPVLLNAVHGLLATDPQLREMARSIRMSKPRQVCSIELPAAVPSILLGLRTSLAIAVIVAVVAEMLASSGGLGDELIEASRRFRSADVYALVLVLAAVGATANGLVHHAERRILGRSLPEVPQP